MSGYPSTQESRRSQSQDIAIAALFEPFQAEQAFGAAFPSIPSGSPTHLLLIPHPYVGIWLTIRVRSLYGLG